MGISRQRLASWKHGAQLCARLHARAAFGERPHVDFETPGFVGEVPYPMAVGREGADTLRELCLQRRHGLSVSEQWRPLNDVPERVIMAQTRHKE
jgi:hypothetical protein